MKLKLLAKTILLGFAISSSILFANDGNGHGGHGSSGVSFQTTESIAGEGHGTSGFGTLSISEGSGHGSNGLVGGGIGLNIQDDDAGLFDTEMSLGGDGPKALQSQQY